MICNNCGNNLKEGDLFCNQCGHAVKKQSSNINQNFESTNNPVQQQYNNYNNYGNVANNSNNAINVFIIILLILIFGIAGWFVGQLIFKDKTDTKNLGLANELLNLISNTENNNPNLEQDSESNILNNNNNNSNNNNNNNNNSNSDLNVENSSYIITDNGKKIYFQVANTLSEDLSISTNEYRLYERKVDDTILEVWIGEEYSSINEFMEEIQDKADRRKTNPDYNNIVLSEIQTRTVNGKEFSFRTFDYNMEDTNFKNLYIAYEIEEDSLYVIEVNEYQLLTDTELNGLLNISM